jgi:hypothetical protein
MEPGMPANPKLNTALSDRYVIEREIGSGGMAIVYLARDRKLDREVALKVLRPELGAVLGSERFLTEIKISARLDHPHILTLIDSGDADGTLYYVLPFVRGETLREKLNREHQLSLTEALAIAKQVAGALDYAHRQGLVHRDIKPENILLQEGEAMLMDFGIALAVKEAGGNRLTQTGLSLGTPQYMSPEQATGDRGIDARSDVYSLAAVLYEMLGGEPPVTGASAQAMIAKLMTEKPVRLRVLRDTVPDAVDAAVARALSKTPADRFASAEEFVRALEAGVTTGGAEATTGAAVAAPVRSRRTAMYAGAAVLVLAVAGGAWAMRGRFVHHNIRASLGHKTQLTVTGEIYSPAISPDGKQLAYVGRHCDAGACTYSVVLQDVGGTTTRSILEGATSEGGLEWSPDRRNLLFQGTIAGQWGSHLLSALGGPPLYLGGRPVTFYAGGDSLLIGPTFGPDSVFWVRIASLDGVPHDSVAVHGPGQALATMSAIPGTEFILTLVIQAPHGLWQMINRSGKVVDKVLNSCTCGGIGTLDAVWLGRAAGTAGDAMVRIPIDRSTGHFVAVQDTMITAHFNSISVTADGAKMVMDEGTRSFGAWATTFSDMLAAKLPDDRLIARASNSVHASISPDGARILITRLEPTGDGPPVARYTVRPFSSGAEQPVPVTGKPLGMAWLDSVTVRVRTRGPSGGLHLALVDIRSGAQRNPLDVPDSTMGPASPLPDGWVWAPTTRDRILVERAGTRRELKMPSWYSGIDGLEASADGRRVFMKGWNRSTADTLGVDAIDLDDGSNTRWVTLFSEGGDVQALPDGSVLFLLYKTAESLDLYRLTAPGVVQFLGRPARPGLDVHISNDLKRVTVNARDYHADAWMYDVARY